MFLIRALWFPRVEIRSQILKTIDIRKNVSQHCENAKERKAHTAYFVTCVCQVLSQLLWEWCLYSVLLTEYRRKWRSSFLSESCNKKGNIHGKSRLFLSGFSKGIQWARRVSIGPEELSLNTWITFLKLNSYLVICKSVSLHEVNTPSTESLWILS